VIFVNPSSLFKEFWRKIYRLCHKLRLFSSLFFLSLSRHCPSHTHTHTHTFFSFCLTLSLSLTTHSHIQDKNKHTHTHLWIHANAHTPTTPIFLYETESKVQNKKWVFLWESLIELLNYRSTLFVQSKNFPLIRES